MLSTFPSRGRLDYGVSLYCKGEVCGGRLLREEQAPPLRIEVVCFGNRGNVFFPTSVGERGAKLGGSADEVRRG